MPGYTFIPFASVSEACAANSIILNSPTKAFNIAGLQIANIICKDSERRRKIDRYINIYEVCDVNPFGVLALEAAYDNSADWLDQLILYIADNYKYLVDFFKQKLPNIEVLKLEGTYLAWIDITATNLSSEEAYNKLLQGKVMLNNGTLYGETSGEGYLRLNLACPRQTLKEGLERIVSALK